MTNDDPLKPFRPACGIPLRGPLVSCKMEVAFSVPGGALVVIEAIDRAAAAAHFQALRQPQPSARAEVRRLTSGLFFSQAQRSGRYWKFLAEAPGHAAFLTARASGPP